MSERFPRSAQYDAAWVAAHKMGPNPLWLMESLCERVELAPGMRVMDLGCGKAITSIFLAREWDVRVFATDLWIPPTESWERIREAGLEDRVVPIHADARSLPYAHGFFDAVVSVDAYHYFGTDDLFLDSVLRYLRPGGQLGIACPGYRRELGAGDVPEHLRDRYRGGQWHTFHSPEWWRRHWEKTGAVKVTCADELPGAWEVWEASAAEPDNPDAEAILADGGSLLTFSRVVAAKR